MEESWNAIFKSLSGGDKKAYDAVFREFYRPLVVYAVRFVGDRDAAEDIVQDFFCYLWEERKRLAGIQSFKMYFYRSVRNRCMNCLRDKRVVSLEGMEEQVEEDFLVEVVEEEVYRELYAAIGRLPGKCREIFLLKLRGSENDEIADRLGISEATVRSQLRRGRELLRETLENLLGALLLAYLYEFNKFC